MSATQTLANQFASVKLAIPPNKGEEGACADANRPSPNTRAEGRFLPHHLLTPPLTRPPSPNPVEAIDRYAPPATSYLNPRDYPRHQITPAIGLRFQPEFQIRDILSLPEGNEKRAAIFKELAYLSESARNGRTGGSGQTELTVSEQSRCTVYALSRRRTSRPPTCSSSRPHLDVPAEHPPTRTCTSTRPLNSAKTANPRLPRSRTSPVRWAARSTSETSGQSLHPLEHTRTSAGKDALRVTACSECTRCLRPAE